MRLLGAARQETGEPALAWSCEAGPCCNRLWPDTTPSNHGRRALHTLTPCADALGRSTSILTLSSFCVELAQGVVCVPFVMSFKPEDPPSFRHLKSPFSKVIATRYYDGPMEGFLGHRDWLQACVFQLLDWDRETDMRVYEIARVEEQIGRGSCRGSGVCEVV